MWKRRRHFEKHFEDTGSFSCLKKVVRFRAPTSLLMEVAADVFVGPGVCVEIRLCIAARAVVTRT
jgi:hypothetical protein